MALRVLFESRRGNPLKERRLEMSNGELLGRGMTKEIAPHSITTQERLSRRRKELQEELVAVEEAMKLFLDHPYLAQAIDLIGRVRI